MRISVFLALLAFVLPSVSANSHEHNARRHSDVVKRAEEGVGLRKRFSNARFTFYQAGMGACGKENSGDDFIVALNSPQYGSGSDCFKQIIITANGKTHGATIVDECPSCPFGALDMSKALFDVFASETAGVIHGSWDFGSGDDSSSSSKITHASPSTHKHTSKTHTRSSTRKPSSLHTYSSTSTSTSTSTSSAPSTTSINYSAGDASGLAVPTGAVRPGAANNLNAFNQAFIGLSALVVAGGNANQ